jgi:DNA mismatch endonuclease (patch repair protein)
MADVLTPEQRRRNMAAIKGKNTGPELLVRRLVHRLGYRYRLHVSGLPGKPDLVFGSRKKVIFVHGCFWHRHLCPMGQVRAKTRAEFWDEKLRGNVMRDSRNIERLRSAGWKVHVVWECETRNLHDLEASLRCFLDW